MESAIHSHWSTVTSFRDALGLGLELSDEFAYAQAALLLSVDGTIMGATVSTSVGVGLTSTLAWCLAEAPPDQSAEVLMLTVRCLDLDRIYEQDLELYRRVERTLAGTNLGLVDWIETDGDCARSFAYLIHPDTAWSTDPASHRRADGV